MAESEAETPSTPGEFESKYFEFHGVRLPPFCRGKMEEIANFPVRPSDVWIVTYPKSGTSLLQEAVYLVSQGAAPDEVGLMNIEEQLPVLEFPQPGLDIIKELTSPRLIKSHLPYRFLPSDLHNGDSKVIYMARNPKDLVVSYYQFHRSLRTMSYRGTFQEFCRRFMNDKLGYGSWFEHVQEFWEHRMDANVLFLKYEDMHRDLVTMVEQLARFLGVSCDKAQLETLIEHCHQLVDQCCNAEALPVGRGTRPCPPRRSWPCALHAVLEFTGWLPGCVRLCGQEVLGGRLPRRPHRADPGDGFGAVMSRSAACAPAGPWEAEAEGGASPRARGAGGTGGAARPGEGVCVCLWRVCACVHVCACVRGRASRKCRPLRGWPGSRPGGRVPSWHGSRVWGVTHLEAGQVFQAGVLPRPTRVALRALGAHGTEAA
ncbi:sulfotransferase 4A1 isoform X1 [Hippopotamus amphibius kiboko]|uniref:sulfotransferase 4A1 isoform X1 n=1 Tax=Hippopotamus amphibius kiboko TaxID=575201 RepID=UPI0025983FB3|nr:sulfotransferase 4A1 isoform X1 [Hippopotamus amphibius kiboko]